MVCVSIWFQFLFLWFRPPSQHITFLNPKLFFSFKLFSLAQNDYFVLFVARHLFWFNKGSETRWCFFNNLVFSQESRLSVFWGSRVWYTTSFQRLQDRDGCKSLFFIDGQRPHRSPTFLLKITFLQGFYSKNGRAKMRKNPALFWRLFLGSNRFCSFVLL